MNMDFNKNPLNTLLFVLPFIFLFATCKKNKGECIGNAYSLKETWNVLPQRDSINIGDTLIFSSSFSNNPFDYKTNTNVDFSGNAVIGTSFSIRIVKGFGDLRPSIDSFTLFSLEGTMKANDISPNQIKDIRWIEYNNFYSSKIGIIAKRKGDYCITVSDAFGRLNKTNECESGAGIYLSNKSVKNNAYLLRPYYSLPNVPADDSAHIFCIRVK